MSRPSRPYLLIPDPPVSPAAAASPSTNSANAQTGRPPLWTPSALRKMTRLYLYSTLPLPKIIEIIHNSNIDSGPK